TERDVADGVVVVGGRVGLPHLDAGLHQLAHRGLEVVVPDDAAGDARGARAGARLVEDHDVRARAEAARAQLLREVVGGREPVAPGSDDDEARLRGDAHYRLQGNGISNYSNARLRRPPGRPAIAPLVARRFPALEHGRLPVRADGAGARDPGAQLGLGELRVL